MTAAAATKYFPVPGAPVDCGADGVDSNCFARPYGDVEVAQPSSPLASRTSVNTKLYRRRWLMLAIFVLYSLCNACQWIQYSIVSNVVEKYYGVSSYAVDWTSIVYMLTYFPLVLPATAFMDYVGLKKGMMLGAASTAVGSWIKCASVAPNRFALTLAGQTVVAASQVFVLGVPPQLASAWFGSREMATACSLGVFGNMLGIACSFVLTPLLVQDHEHQKDVEKDLSRLFYITAAFATAIFLLITFLFQERPPLPPSPEAAARAPVRPGCLAPLRRLLARPPFCLLMAVVAINVGVVSALSTLLNQLVLQHFQDGQELAGRLGLVVVLGSMVGSVASGIVLDRTQGFKETTVALFALSMLSMLGFTFALPTGSEPLVYTAGAAIGLFMGGYMPVGFEFASELTYPESENTTGGVLMAGTQILAVGYTIVYAWLVKTAGDVWANLALSATLLLGCVLAVLIRPDLRRQAARAAVLNRAAGAGTPGSPAPSDASDSTEGTDVDDAVAPPPLTYSPLHRIATR